jgi:hypothetical protein
MKVREDEKACRWWGSGLLAEVLISRRRQANETATGVLLYSSGVLAK